MTEAGRARRNGNTLVRLLRLGLPWLLLTMLGGCMIREPAPVEVRNHGRGGTSSGDYYIVQPGETLYSIAWRHGTDYRSLARLNRIDPPYRIYPGQRLRLRGAPPKASGTTAVAAASTSTGAKTGERKSDSGAKTARRPAASTSKPAAATPPSSPKPAQAPAAELTWRWPTDGRVLRRFTADAIGKQGIEIGGRAGQTVVAAAKGQVVYAGSGLRGYGNLIIVKHNSRYLTAYGYNQDLLVREGETVAAGQAIATMGYSPSRRPALHFELRRDGKPVDPLSYLPAK